MYVCESWLLLCTSCVSVLGIDCTTKITNQTKQTSYEVFRMSRHSGKRVREKESKQLSLNEMATEKPEYSAIKLYVCWVELIVCVAEWNNRNGWKIEQQTTRWWWLRRSLHTHRLCMCVKRVRNDAKENEKTKKTQTKSRAQDKTREKTSKQVKYCTRTHMR